MEELYKAVEDVLLRHRFLYYVKGTPVMSDYDYDRIEKIALTFLPDNSVIRKPGSDLVSSYPEYIINQFK